MDRLSKILIATGVFVILSISSITSVGCNSDAAGMKTAIDRRFLYEIEMAFKEETASGQDKSRVYNTLWESNYYELIYLTQKGDKKAIDISLSLIGQRKYPACLWEEIELLIKPTYESDTDYFWKTLAKKDYDTQITALHAFDYHRPLDWDLDHYFTQYPDVMKLYYAKYTTIDLGDQMHR